jgi:uncharacterized protein YggE
MGGLIMRIALGRRAALSTLAVIGAIAAAGPAHAAGSIVINATGRASAAPELVRVTVGVTSICYESSRAAKDANATLANSILTALRTFASDPRDEVHATGGVNVRQTEYVFDGGSSRVLCENKWRATNTLTIKTANIDALPDLQDALLAAVDLSAVDPGQMAQTYGELSQPVFDIYPETSQRLRREAQIAAYDDARTQLETFQSRCALDDAQLTSIAPPEFSAFARGVNGEAMPAADSASTPVIPTDITVQASWRFEWSFTPSSDCKL